jgi:hypothetical protein
LADVSKKCRLWVKSCPDSPEVQLALFPRNRTSTAGSAMSVQCQNRKWQASFDHLVGAGEKRRRDLDTERFRGLEIDGKQEFGGLLNWKVGRFGAF